jgi:hypothetical protein
MLVTTGSQLTTGSLDDISQQNYGSYHIIRAGIRSFIFIKRSFVEGFVSVSAE